MARREDVSHDEKMHLVADQILLWAGKHDKLFFKFSECLDEIRTITTPVLEGSFQLLLKKGKLTKSSERIPVYKMTPAGQERYEALRAALPPESAKKEKPRGRLPRKRQLNSTPEPIPESESDSDESSSSYSSATTDSEQRNKAKDQENRVPNKRPRSNPAISGVRRSSWPMADHVSKPYRSSPYADSNQLEKKKAVRFGEDFSSGDESTGKVEGRPSTPPTMRQAAQAAGRTITWDTVSPSPLTAGLVDVRDVNTNRSKITGLLATQAASSAEKRVKLPAFLYSASVELGISESATMNVLKDMDAKNELELFIQLPAEG